MLDVRFESIDTNPNFFPEEVGAEKNNNLTLLADNLSERNEKDSKVDTVRFIRCNLISIPPGMTERFCNLKQIIINGGSCKFGKEDLQHYPNVRKLWVSYCNVENLPGDLFEATTKLEVVSFFDCNIKYIGSDILDCLPQLQVAKFDKNVNINAAYDKFNHHKTLNYGTPMFSLENLKIILKSPELIAPADYQFNVDRYSEFETEKNEDNFADVMMQVDDMVFKTHREILAKSPYFKSVFERFSDVDSFMLRDISQEDFQQIIEFYYAGRLSYTSNEQLTPLLEQIKHMDIALGKHIKKALEENLTNKLGRKVKIKSVIKLKRLDPQEKLATSLQMYPHLFD